MFLNSFAVRTKNIENKPVVNERGQFNPFIYFRQLNVLSTYYLLSFYRTDNRPVPKPHFAAVSIQPPAGKPAPAIVQAISTAGSGSGTARGRASLVPVSRPRRMSTMGGVNAYQPFGLPIAAASRRLPGINEKVQESESDRSGSLGFGLTEKEIDERVCCCSPLDCDMQAR